MAALPAASADLTEQSRHNNEVWGGGDFVAGYANRILRPVEVILLARYRDAFAGRVLEIGCGAGRMTGYIVQLGGDVLGIDISPRMVDFCRRTYPQGEYRLGDLGDLSAVEESGFDVVFLGNNLIDVLADAERRRTIAGLARFLGPRGVLIMSSHNRGHAPSIPGVVEAVTMKGTVEGLHRALRVPWWLVNRRRLRRHEVETDTYAVLNDDAHDFRLLHYYIARDSQEQQLNELGYELVECLDEEGLVVPPGGQAPAHGELHYIARCSAGGSRLGGDQRRRVASQAD